MTLSENTAQSRSDRFANPVNQCDLIMKGGITSGVVYPKAILKLAETYRFRSIGGTSAGAIAATVTAAAEYARDNEGFETLEKMSNKLADPEFLLKLIQPKPKVKALFKASLLALEWWNSRPPKDVKEPPNPSEQPKKRSLFALLLKRWFGCCEESRDFRRAFLWSPWFWLGLLGGASFAALLSAAALLPWARLLSSETPFLIAAIVFMVIAALISGHTLPILYGVYQITKADNSFGMCSACAPGEPHQNGEDGPLTNWMHHHIQAMAKTNTPLTLRDLLDHEHPIKFQAVTTNLTLGRPHLLPFNDKDDEAPQYLFDEKDLANLFPASVVQYLTTRSGKKPVLKVEDLVLHELPLNADLPLIVAMRLSLSFPILLHAVRLYRQNPHSFSKKTTDLTKKDFDAHWFSDGGISSNFPIHLFDAWWPRRPTFGINLRDTLKTPKDFVVRPEPGDLVSGEAPKQRIESIVHFLQGIFRTSSNYRDNTQAALPGYRERIAHVYLEPHEGGLNLSMEQGTILDIAGRGEKAAQKFLRDFDFQHHRWVRLRSLMSRLEVELGCVYKSYRDEVEKDKGEGKFSEADVRQAMLDSYLQLIEKQRDAWKNADDRWYCGIAEDDKLWFDHAQKRVEGLFALMKAWAEHEAEWRAERKPSVPNKHPSHFYFFSDTPPYPHGLLRLTPEL